MWFSKRKTKKEEDKSEQIELQIEEEVEDTMRLEEEDIHFQIVYKATVVHTDKELI